MMSGSTRRRAGRVGVENTAVRLAGDEKDGCVSGGPADYLAELASACSRSMKTRIELGHPTSRRWRLQSGTRSPRRGSPRRRALPRTVRSFRRTRTNDAAVREDHLHCAQAVDREPVLARQESDLAGDCDTSHANPAVVARTQGPNSYGFRARATFYEVALGPIRTRRCCLSRISIESSLRRSITSPPSLVDRPLMPWLGLLMPRGRWAWARANASASATSDGVLGWITTPGDPLRR